MFEQLTDYRDDPIEDFQARLARDEHPDKLDLGIGVYRDEQGAITVLDCVREAEKRVVERAEHKGYRGPIGNVRYNALVEDLVLGDLTRTLSIRSIQTPGAGAACHVGATFVKRLSPQSTVWASTPCWLHQSRFFETAGLDVRYFPYYDQARTVAEFDEMLAALREARAGDIVLLHGSCHNPTGEDPPLEVWRHLGRLCADRGAVPFVDVAYQGYGDGIVADVLGARTLAEMVPEMLLAVSSSKSFTIYCDRAGILSLVSNGAAASVENARRMLRDVARDSYFMPPEHGAAIVAEILDDERLRVSWERQLGSMRDRLHALRRLLRDAFQSAGLDGEYFVRQKGMFSCLPITAEQQEAMEQRHGIFMLPGARVNFAALSEDKVERIASAVVAVAG